MSCTEAEAKTKWCPMYRVATSGGVVDTYETDNRPPEYGRVKPTNENPNEWKLTGKVPPVAACLGSRCMAWVWNEPPGPQHPEDKRERDNRGFCGFVTSSFLTMPLPR